MRKRLVVMGGLALFFVLSADACLLWAQERVQDRRQLTITFTDGTKQTVTLRQDAGNIVSLEYTGGAPAGGGGSAGGAGRGR